MKSIIIPHTNTQDNLTNKLQLLLSRLNASSTLELYLTQTIYQAFKNNPIPNNTKTHQNLKFDIIQIIQQYANNQEFNLKEPSISAINNGIWKLVKKGVIVKIDGLYFLNSCFKDIDQVEQIVFRFYGNEE